MRKTLLAVWFLLPTVAFSQNAPTVGDIYESGTPQPVEQAFQKLHQIAAEITADPSSFYVQGRVDKSQWPAVDQAQAQWYTAMSQAGTGLTPDQRNNIVPCAAHLNNAIGDMERGYLIHITQESNPPAQATATKLYGEAQDEFAKCQATDTGPGGGRAPANPGGGTPGSAGDNPPGTKGLQRTPGSGGPGTGPASGPGQTPGPGGPTSGPTSGPGPSPGNPTTPPPNMAAVDKTIENCLNKYEPYLKVQSLSPAYMEMALYSAPQSAKAVPFAQLPGQTQIFLEESAWALQVQAAHDAKYGGNEYNPAQSQDYMVGWLDLCLFWTNREANPNDHSAHPDPRVEYAKFLGVPLMDSRIDIFSNGGQDFFLPPLPLMAPRTPPPSL